MSQGDVDRASGSSLGARPGTVSRALMISPSVAPNPKLQLRINTSIDNPAHYLDPPPRYQAHIETVRTAPLFLQPPPRRAFSQDVDAMTATKTPALTANPPRPLHIPTLPGTPASPPLTSPRPRTSGATHGRKISQKFKSIFAHSRKTSADLPQIPPPVSGSLVGPAKRISHRRNESAPGASDARIIRWIHETAIEGERNPRRPHRSPNTASFIVSADNRFEPIFPRHDPATMTMHALHSGVQKAAGNERMNENDIVEPITAALYPLGKGLLGTTRRRAHLEDCLPGIHRIEVSHSSQTTPAIPHQDKTEHLDVSEDQEEPTYASSASSAGSSFDAMWYMTPHY